MCCVNTLCLLYTRPYGEATDMARLFRSNLITWSPSQRMSRFRFVVFIISLGFANKVYVLKLIGALQCAVSTQEAMSYFRNKVHKWTERVDKPLLLFVRRPRGLLTGNPCSGWALKTVMHWSGICLVIDLQENNVVHALWCGKHFIKVFLIRHRNTLHEHFHYNF